MNETPPLTKRPQVYHGGKFKKITDGKRCMVVLPTDVHEFLRAKGGSKWLTELLRREQAIEALTNP